MRFVDSQIRIMKVLPSNKLKKCITDRLKGHQEVTAWCVLQPMWRLSQSWKELWHSSAAPCWQQQRRTVSRAKIFAQSMEKKNSPSSSFESCSHHRLDTYKTTAVVGNDLVDLPMKGIESMKRWMELSGGVYFRDVQKICAVPLAHSHINVTLLYIL